MMTVLSAQTVILAVIVVSANPGWCQSNQMAFKMTKFPGNTTVQSLAFQPTAFLTVLPNVSIVACGSSCIAVGTCNSFNWVEGSPASFGRCEIINGSTWTPSLFVSRTTESSKFFVNEVLSKTDGYYVIIPAINQDPVNLDNPSIIHLEIPSGYSTCWHLLLLE
ncbi:unnamed protein product [Notodromas monacha]|uniref:Apple domain-containing protein n=1 Tax=Notodromas monacha TaxID=399045 RepID=A0A7R9BT59_9CRUS|nr:unnamed protein product [Notodromas monacha]CAG0921276.1 unnamed protein product [Notodromas monacha]